MKARCPHCKDGCDKCDRGWIEVSFASTGHYHALICNVCEVGVGGRLHSPTRPLRTDLGGAVCPHCGGHNLRLSTCEESIVSSELAGIVTGSTKGE